MSHEDTTNVSTANEVGTVANDLYSGQVTAAEIRVNGPDSDMCKHLAENIRDGSIDLNVETPVFDGNSNSTSPSKRKVKPATKKKSKDGETSEKKLKCEPGNSWLQFCSFKKNQAIQLTGDKKACYNQKDASDEWSKMSMEEKEPFVNLAKAEKASLGEAYRVNRGKKNKKNKANSEDMSAKNGGKVKPPKIKKAKSPKVKKVKKDVDPSVEAEDFVNKLEELDQEMDFEIEKNMEFVESLAKENIQLSVGKTKLNHINAEIEKTEDKYNVLFKQHSSCKRN